MKRILILVFLVIVGIGFVGYTTLASPSDKIQMQGGGALSGPPVWRLTIGGTGQVIHESLDSRGQWQVKQTCKIGVQQINDLLRQFEKSGFFELRDVYPDPIVSETAPTTLSINLNGREKKIQFYEWCVPKCAPKDLKDLAGKVSQVAACPDSTSTKTFEIKIHPGLPVYVFRVKAQRHNGDEDSADSKYAFHQIEVLRKGSPKVIQILDIRWFFGKGPTDFRDVEAEYYGEQDVRYGPLIQGEDINFDGYQDLKLRMPSGTSGIAYDYWLFDERTGLFKTQTSAIMLVQPKRNLQTREITTTESFGNAGASYRKRTYKFIHENLILLREENQNEIENKRGYFLRGILERKNGKMVLVEKEIVHIPPK